MSELKSKPFSDMAERIARNDEKEFAGAFVVVGPDGTVLSNLMVNPKADAAAFWAAVSTTVEIAVQEFRNVPSGQFGGVPRR